MKRYKAQISIEALAIIGVVVLGALVFASFYISNVNKNVDRLTDLDPDFTELIPGGPGGSFPTVPGGGGDSGPGSACGQPGACEPGTEAGCTDGTGSMFCTSVCTWDTSNCSSGPSCGNNILEDGEQCELVDGSYVFANADVDCTDNPDMPPSYFWTGGYVSCSSCQYDFSDCTYSPSSFRFRLVLEPFTASANQNQLILTDLSIDFDPEGIGVVSEWVDVSVSVKTNLGGFEVYTNNCSYDGQTIPATADGLEVKKFYPSDGIYSKNISCSEDGVYFFTFSAVDDQGYTDDKQLEFTVPFTQSVYSLCREQTNSNGTIDLCLNHFSEGETSTAPNGEATFYVNFPTSEEYNVGSAIVAFSDAVCDSSESGQVCFTLGFD